MLEKKPCPFCGSANVHTRVLPAMFKQVGRGWTVICYDCYARGPFVRMDKYGKTSHSTEAKLDAVHQWNNVTREVDGNA